MPRAHGGATEERQLALLVANALDYAIFMLDTDGLVLTWNPGAERMYGYTREEVVGRRFLSDEELSAATRGRSHEDENWRTRKDGTRFWASVAITPVQDEDGEPVGFGIVSRDLTERRRHEEELAEFQRLVSGVRDYAIFMLDATGHVRSWNAGAERLKGYAPEEIIGRHFAAFYTRPDKDRDHPAHELEIAQRDGVYEEEGWRVRKDGSTFWASVTITAIRDDEGTLTGFAKVTRDLTERKRGEDQLLRTNAELDRFAAVAAHDMTDPLRTISGFAEVLVEEELTPEERQEYSQHILDSSLRLSGMLDGLLAYARAGRPVSEARQVDLAVVGRQVLADLRRLIEECKAQVDMELAAEASVLADPHDVRTLLQNLVSNAVKFGDPGGRVVAVRTERTNGRWRVTVADNGPGIDELEQARIFDAFHRASGTDGQVGYGLGLAICKRLAERHGGTLSLESERGRGSRFWFDLPAVVD